MRLSEGKAWLGNGNAEPAIPGTREPPALLISFPLPEEPLTAKLLDAVRALQQQKPAVPKSVAATGN